MTIEIVVLLVLLVLSGLFSGSETALVSLSLARAESLVKEGRRGAQALYQLKTDQTRMLTAILIGNNLVNIAASVIATVLATRVFGSAGPGVAVGVLTILVLVFGEITPKSMATHYPERLSLLISPLLLTFMRVIYPFVWIFGRFTQWLHDKVGAKGDPIITESELISMLGHGEREGTIEQGERELIERVFAFHDLKVGDVMTPYDDIFTLDGKLPIADALPQAVEESYSRIPLYNHDRENLFKLVSLRDILTAVAAGDIGSPLEDIAHELLFVPQYQSIDELFATFRREKAVFAIVVDEYGSVRGLVTLEDLLEELVGEIYDESDTEPVPVDYSMENEITLDGNAELRVIEEFFSVDLPGKPTDSVNLWILTHTEEIPKTGEIFTIDSFETKIIKASPRRIEQVTIHYPATTASQPPPYDSS